MIEVIKAGLLSTIQDQGRIAGFTRGIPQSGAMDDLSAQLANQLLQNEVEAAVIECTVLGPTLLFHTQTTIVITGGQGNFFINDQRIDNFRLIKIQAGDKLVIGPIVAGVRSYIGIKGGLRTPIVLGSRSYYKGVNDYGKLIAGSIIPIENNTTELQDRLHLSINNPMHISTKLSVSKGPEYDLIKERISIIIDKELVIGNNDRMAYIVDSELENNLGAMLTTHVFPGVVQLTPNGQLLFLMRDCQVTGGYPRILILEENSINTLAQLRKGQMCSLNLVE